MMELITNTITLGTAIGLGITLLARFIPNEKLFSWGLSFGKLLNGFGSVRFGNTAWEKVEDFLINSIGEFLRGMKSGLDDGEG